MDNRKLAGKHKSLTEAATPIVEFLLRQTAIKKISPGVIVNSRNRNQANNIRVKSLIRNTNILLKISASGNVQEIRVYPLRDHYQEVQELLQAYCEVKGIRLTVQIRSLV